MVPFKTLLTFDSSMQCTCRSSNTALCLKVATYKHKAMNHLNSNIDKSTHTVYITKLSCMSVNVILSSSGTIPYNGNT